MTEEEVYHIITGYLVKDFEIDPSKIHLEANLFLDLEMDSIDALDWFIKMESELKVRQDEKELKKVRTVRDVVAYVLRHVPS